MLRNLRLLLTVLVLWAVPVGAVWICGMEDVLFREALFFTGAAFVTFGGAYAVLSYVADVAVNHYGWLTADQMVQGLGLAESTPGPLIMVTQYVGFIGAWNDPGPFAPTLQSWGFDCHLRDVPAVLFVHLLARPVHRASAQQPEDQGHPRRSHRRRGRRDRPASQSTSPTQVPVPRGRLSAGARRIRPRRCGRLLRRAAKIQSSHLPHGPRRRSRRHGMDALIEVATTARLKA